MESLKVYYWNGVKNAGDYFSKWILDKMNIKNEFSKKPDIIISGSILNCSPAEHSKIWGVGFHNVDEKKKLQKENIYAVRGKLTLKNLDYNDIVTGDPGILASYFYKSHSKKKFKFGIIPHYVDYDWVKSLNLQNVKIINISTENLEKLFDEINECEFILSSSLHGIIFSHSYGIPAFHFKHKELASKNSFKFLDYYSNFNLKYMMKQVNSKSDFDFKEFELLYKNKEKFVPTPEEIKSIQKRLLDVFPYKEMCNLRNC